MREARDNVDFARVFGKSVLDVVSIVNQLLQALGREIRLTSDTGEPPLHGPGPVLFFGHGLYARRKEREVASK